jgi:PAS domain S-box-containing protein
MYCLPVSLLAVIPGVYMSFKDGYPIIAIVDILSFTLLFCVTVSNSISLKTRKIFIITLFNVLAVFLISVLGYVGPGVFYLFAITILTALVFPIRFAYLLILSHTLILLGFALVIDLKLFNCALIKDYSAGKWLAFSSNLVFLSIVLVILIQRILESLQTTIKNKDYLQEKYKKLFDRSPMPMWLFDTKTLAFLDVNEAAVRHYGYTREDFLSMTIKDIRPSRNAENIENLVKANRISGAFYEGHAEHTKKNGENIYVKIESNLVELEGQAVRLVLATDITDDLNNQLEVFNVNQRIKESESNLKAIFENSIDGFVLLDNNYYIKTFNSKALDYIKFSNQQSEFETGKNIFDFIEFSGREYLREVLKKVISGGEVIEYDRNYPAAKGDLWIRYTITPVFQDNTVKGACISGRDVTARKMYVKTVEAQNKTFREISWMQSHLVRAPLARIMGLTQLLKDSTNEDEKAEVLGFLTASSAELDDIIKLITQKSAYIVETHALENDQNTFIEM